jgi:hypothetical protein
MANTELTNEQKEKILKEWDGRPDSPPSLLELIRVAYPDSGFDGRSKQGRLVKEFLATKELKARAAHEYQHKEKIELSKERKEFISNNITTMTANELARVVFANPDLMPLSQETRTVIEYVNTLESIPVYEPPQGREIVEEYIPPKTQHSAILKVNRYVLGGIDKNKITSRDKNNVASLIRYLHTYRFLHQISSYNLQNERELFESSFVRYTHDKPDLSQEEVDQYIVLCTEVIIASRIQVRSSRLQELLDNVAEDTDGRRVAMSLVEAISSAQTEYNQCVNRQQKLLGDLKEKRSDKLKKQIKENASILNLVSLWKEEENRAKLVKLAEKRKKTLGNEIEKLSNMDDVKSRIMGITENEVFNG